MCLSSKQPALEHAIQMGIALVHSPEKFSSEQTDKVENSSTAVILMSRSACRAIV